MLLRGDGLESVGDGGYSSLGAIGLGVKGFGLVSVERFL